LRYPLDNSIKALTEIPYTIAYIIRKRQQVDNLMELDKSKRPSDDMIWNGTSEELESFLERVISGKENPQIDIVFNEFEIEK
jgi:hypothetical protein